MASGSRGGASPEAELGVVTAAAVVAEAEVTEATEAAEREVLRPLRVEDDPH